MIAGGSEPTYVSADSTYQWSTSISDSLSVIDISNPIAPVQISSFASAQTKGAEGIECAGIYCYMAAPSANAVDVLNISNAHSITQTGYLVDATHFHNATGIALSGNYAYTVSDTGWVNVVNVSNPATPLLVGSTQNAVAASPTVLSVKGSYLYVGSSAGTLSVWGVSNPASPTLIGQTNTGVGGSSFYLGNRYAYTIYGADYPSITASGLTIIDVSNPAATPVPVVGSVSVPFGSVLWSVKCAGRYCYATDIVLNKIFTFDISNPTAPTIVNTIQDNTNLNGADDLSFSGDYVYVTLNNRASGTVPQGISIWRLTGENVNAATIGHVNTDDITVNNSVSIGRDLTVQDGVITGPQGVNSGGSVTGPNLLAVGTGGAIGYATGTGAGCAVTQGTSRTTGVTCSGNTGAITLFSAAGSATSATFTVTDNKVAATDAPEVVEKSGTNLYECFVTAVTAGTFNVTFFTTGGTATDAPVFNFTVLKGSAN